MTFEDFLRAELPGLSRFAAVLVGSRHDAHDVLVDALVVAHQRWTTISELEQPLAYVRKIVVNTFLSDRRKAARRKTAPDGLTPSPKHPVQQPADSDTALFAAKLLGSLPPRQRAVLVLRYYLDLPDAQIAQNLGMAEGTVRSTACAALRALRVTADADDLRKG